MESARLDFLVFRLSPRSSLLLVDPRLPRLLTDRLLVGTVRSPCSGVSGIRDEGWLVMLDARDAVGISEVGTSDPMTMAPIPPKDPLLRGVLALCILSSMAIPSKVSRLFDRNLGSSSSNSSNNPVNPPRWLNLEPLIPSNDLIRKWRSLPVTPARSRSVKVGLVDRVGVVDRS